MLSLNFIARFSITILGRSKENCNWHDLTVSILLVLKSFIKIYLSQNREILNQFSLVGKLLESITK